MVLRSASRHPRLETAGLGRFGSPLPSYQALLAPKRPYRDHRRGGGYQPVVWRRGSGAANLLAVVLSAVLHALLTAVRSRVSSRYHTLVIRQGCADGSPAVSVHDAGPAPPLPRQLLDELGRRRRADMRHGRLHVPLAGRVRAPPRVSRNAVVGIQGPSSRLPTSLRAAPAVTQPRANETYAETQAPAFSPCAPLNPGTPPKTAAL